MDEGRKHFAGLTLSPVDDDETLITVIPSLSRPIQEPLARCIMLHDASDVWAVHEWNGLKSLKSIPPPSDNSSRSKNFSFEIHAVW